jgi:hypothetical protein
VLIAKLGHIIPTPVNRTTTYHSRGEHANHYTRAEEGANIFGVLRVKKNHDFTPKKIIFFPILGIRP